MNARTVVAATSLLIFLLGTPGVAPGRIIFRVKNIQEVSLAAMIEDLRGARVIFFGERHDSAADHVAQRTVLQSLHDSGAAVAVGMEMFRRDAQPVLDLWVGRDVGEEALRKLYDDNWSPDLWDLYNDILIYARQESIPVVGLNIRRQIISRIARDGFESLSPEEKEELQVDSCDVTGRYEEVLRRVTGGKAKGAASFGNFCQAQIAWDTAMAKSIADYLEANQDRIMVVVCGTFHAWRHGIPERLRAIMDVPMRIVLPSSDETYLNYDVILEDADYVWWQQ